MNDLLLLGTHKCDLQGEERLTKFLEWYKPDVISLEVSRREQEHLDMFLAEKKDIAAMLRNQPNQAFQMIKEETGFEVNLETYADILETYAFEQKVVSQYLNTYNVNSMYANNDDVDAYYNYGLNGYKSGDVLNLAKVSSMELLAIINNAYEGNMSIDDAQKEFLNIKNDFVQKNIDFAYGALKKPSKILHLTSIPNMVNVSGDFVNLTEHLKKYKPSTFLLSDADLL